MTTSETTQKVECAPCCSNYADYVYRSKLVVAMRSLSVPFGRSLRRGRGVGPITASLQNAADICLLNK